MSMFTKRMNILKVIAQHDSIDREWVEEEFNLSQATAVVILRDFRELGFIEQIGSSRNITYSISQKVKDFFKEDSK